MTKSFVYSPQPCVLQFEREKYFVPCERSNGTIEYVEPVFIDLETTGLNRQTCDVVELGLLDLTHVLIHAFTTWRKGADVRERALEINGFDPEEAKKSDKYVGSREQLLSECQKRWAGKVIVGCNPAFDQAFIERDLWQILREEPTWHYKPIDVSTFALPYIGNLTNLKMLAKRFNASTVPVHTAVTDAEATRQIYIALMNELLLTEQALLIGEEDTTDLAEEHVRVGGNLSE